MQADLGDWIAVGVFFLFGLLFVFGGLLASRLLRPRNPNPAKSEIYECGATPIGSAWMQFHVGYYLIALIFVLFEVEVAFLFPWAALFRDLPSSQLWSSLIAVGVFIGVLALADAYAWKKGALEWL